MSDSTPELLPLETWRERWEHWRHRRRLEAPARRARARSLGARLLADTALLAGCGAIVYGVREVYEPAAFITGGICLVLLAIFTARGRGQ